MTQLSLTPEHLPPSELRVQQQIATVMAGHHQNRASRSRRSKRRPNWFRRNLSITLAIVGTMLAGLLWLGGLTLRTSDGTLIVENLPPEANVLIDGQRLKIK